jgi:hypothetical protein
VNRIFEVLQPTKSTLHLLTHILPVETVNQKLKTTCHHAVKPPIILITMTAPVANRAASPKPLAKIEFKVQPQATQRQNIKGMCRSVA